MDVKFLNLSGETRSNTVTFTYTKKNVIKISDVTQDIHLMKDMNDLQEALKTALEIAKRMGEISLKDETGQPGEPGKHYLLVELIMIKSKNLRRKDPIK